MTSIEKLIESIESELESAWQLPMFGGKVLVEVKEIKKLIEATKENLPMEIVQAKKIVQDRSNIIDKAREEAEMMIKGSENKIKELVNNNEIVKLAQEKAKEIVSQAESQSKSIRSSTDEYAANVMKELDETITGSLAEIRKVREMFKSR